MIGTPLGVHYIIIKEKYEKYLNSNNNIMNHSIRNIITNKTEVLEEISDIIDDIMEWTICCSIYENKDNNIILHAGLARTEKIINILTSIYNYKIEKQVGVNNII
jgi:hypothetical protein